MGDDVAADRFFRVCRKHCCAVNLCHDLICDDYGHAELVGDALKHAKELCQVHLAGRELASTGVVCPVEGRCRIDYEQREAVLRHEGCCLDEKLVLLVCVVGAGVRYVVQDLLLVEAEALGDGHEPLRPEGALCVYVHGHAFAATLREW